jgi:nucleotide-binding universal stress UspA family protein
MPNTQLLVASYHDRTDAETASTVLNSAGFDRKKISLIGKDRLAEGDVSGFYKADDHISYWGRERAIWNGDIPVAVFSFPEIGTLLVTGPLAGSIAGVLANAIVSSGISAFEAGFIHWGLSRESVRKYEDAIKADTFLLMVHGDENEITLARDVLHKIGPSKVDCHIVAVARDPAMKATNIDSNAVMAPGPTTRIVMPSSRHILFPIDFSERAKQLLPYVGNIARKFHSDITLLHVLGFYEGVSLGPEMGELDITNYQDQLREQSEAELLRLSAETLQGINVIPVIENGDISQCITRRVNQHDIGLIVIPTHGRGKFRQLLLGSVTSKVLHDNACPVWTTAHAENLNVEHLREIHSIVCAVDTAPDGCRVLKAAFDIASLYGASVRVIHAIPFQQDITFSRFLGDVAKEKIMDLQQAAGTNWDLQIEAGTVPHVVRDAALQHQANLVMIGRGGLTEPMSGLRTNVEAIIRQVPCAVLSV